MRKIRSSVFETNSSSTHSICIAKTQDLDFPSSVNFEFGEFGWENNTLKTIEEKASYLMTGMYANKKVEEFQGLLEILTENGVSYSCEEPEWFGEDDRWLDNGHVDHSDELDEFIKDICASKSRFLSYLFSDLSYIITGNDNDDSDISVNADYPHETYYKGN